MEGSTSKLVAGALVVLCFVGIGALKSDAYGKIENHERNVCKQSATEGLSKEQIEGRYGSKNHLKFDSNGKLESVKSRERDLLITKDHMIFKNGSTNCSELEINL